MVGFGQEEKITQCMEAEALRPTSQEPSLFAVIILAHATCSCQSGDNFIESTLSE